MTPVFRADLMELKREENFDSVNNGPHLTQPYVQGTATSTLRSLVTDK